jgi:hypothetical protein
MALAFRTVVKDAKIGNPKKNTMKKIVAGMRKAFLFRAYS